MGLCHAFSAYPAAAGGGDERPLLVVGFTHHQTSIVVEDRLRAFVRAGFRVVVISSPGELLDRLRDRDGVETIAIAMERRISPRSDLLALFRLYWVLRRLRPDITEFSTPKAGLLGSIAAAVCGVPHRVYLLRGLRLETVAGMKRGLLWFSERVAAACSHLVLCNSRSLLQEAARLRLGSAEKLKILGNGSSRGLT